MPVQVLIPTPLRSLTQQRAVVQVRAGTVREAIAAVDAEYPGIRSRVLDATGRVHRFVNLYVNQEDIRALRDLDTALAEGDELSLVPAIAGG